MVKGGAPATPTSGPPPPPVNIAPHAPSVAPAPSMPNATNIQGNIRAHCLKEWPTVFRMQALLSGAAAGRRNQDGLTIPSRIYRHARRPHDLQQCFKEWPTDYRMQNYCVKQQLEGLKRLAR